MTEQEDKDKEEMRYKKFSGKRSEKSNPQNDEISYKSFQGGSGNVNRNNEKITYKRFHGGSGNVSPSHSPRKTQGSQPANVLNPRGFIPSCSAPNSLSQAEKNDIMNLCKRTSFYDDYHYNQNSINPAFQQSKKITPINNDYKIGVKKPQFKISAKLNLGQSEESKNVLSIDKMYLSEEKREELYKEILLYLIELRENGIDIESFLRYAYNRKDKLNSTVFELFKRIHIDENPHKTNQAKIILLTFIFATFFLPGFNYLIEQINEDIWEGLNFISREVKRTIDGFYDIAGIDLDNFSFEELKNLEKSKIIDDIENEEEEFEEKEEEYKEELKNISEEENQKSQYLVMNEQTKEEEESEVLTVSIDKHKNSKIVYNAEFRESLKKNLKIISDAFIEKYSIKNLNSKTLTNTALQLYDFAKQNGLTPETLKKKKNAGFLSLNLSFYALLKLGIFRLENDKITVKAIANAIAKDYRALGFGTDYFLHSCTLSALYPFMPSDIRALKDDLPKRMNTIIYNDQFRNELIQNIKIIASRVILQSNLKNISLKELTDRALELYDYATKENNPKLEPKYLQNDANASRLSLLLIYCILLSLGITSIHGEELSVKGIFKILSENDLKNLGIPLKRKSWSFTPSRLFNFIPKKMKDLLNGFRQASNRIVYDSYFKENLKTVFEDLYSKLLSSQVIKNFRLEDLVDHSLNLFDYATLKSKPRLRAVNLEFSKNIESIAITLAYYTLVSFDVEKLGNESLNTKLLAKFIGNEKGTLPRKIYNFLPSDVQLKADLMTLGHTYEDIKSFIEQILKAKLLTTKDKFNKRRLKNKLHPSYVKLEIKCNKKHIFPTNLKYLKMGAWCPKCSEGKQEKICRWYVEQILSHVLQYKINFPKTGLNNIIRHSYPSKAFNDLITSGHFDCYAIFQNFQRKSKKIINNGTKEKLKYKKIYSCLPFNDTCLENIKNQIAIDTENSFFREKDLILIEFPFGFIEINYRKGNLELVRNVLYTTQIKLDTIIKLAVEFNGPQHYQFFPAYHKSIKDFLDQVIRDLIKKKISDDSGIILLEFPYRISIQMNESYKIQTYIIDEFERLTGMELCKAKLPSFDHMTQGSYKKLF